MTVLRFSVKGNYFLYRVEKIHIGHNTWIGPNVGIITQNHDLANLYHFQPPKDVIIGNGCWIGMNSVILPGIILGDHTIVGAGSVVTRSFPEGKIVIAGNPARLLKKIEIPEKE